MIIKCPYCGQKNRIDNYNKELKPVCGTCASPLLDEDIKITQNKGGSRIFINLILILFIVGVCVGIYIIPNILAKDFSEVINNEKRKTEKVKEREQRKLVELKKNLIEELTHIDPNVLRHEAKNNYKQIYDARTRYDKRYALSQREKGQLRMLEISSNVTQSYRSIILEVAKEASPSKSEIRIEDAPDGISLHIDFDMSSMTSGEEGTRTKHDTVSSLKKEVVSLISRVSNDVFEFCRGLDIKRMHVGCKHHVNITYPDGTKIIENTILYKIKINKGDVSDFENNPFLDEYSTVKFFKVETDDFDNIEIVREY